MEGRLRFLRFLAYSIEVIVFYVLQGTPMFMPEILGSKPSLLLPVALTVAVFESESVAMSFGFVCGLLTDLGSAGSIGYYTVVMTLLCFAIGYCARNFFVTNLLNASIIGVGSITLLILLQFLFGTLFSGVEFAWTHFAYHYLSRIVYTSLFFVPLYFFNRLFRATMEEN